MQTDFNRSQEVIDREFIAAINAEKQQNPEQQQKAQIQSPAASAVDSRLKNSDSSKDVELGELEDGSEGNIPTKPIRRKFSKTVPYETNLDEDSNDPEEYSVSVSSALCYVVYGVEIEGHCRHNCR